MANPASISKVVPWLLREDLVFGEGMGTQTGRPPRRSSRSPERQGAAWTKEQAMQMEREGGSEVELGGGPTPQIEMTKKHTMKPHKRPWVSYADLHARVTHYFSTAY